MFLVRRHANLSLNNIQHLTIANIYRIRYQFQYLSLSSFSLAIAPISLPFSSFFLFPFIFFFICHARLREPVHEQSNTKTRTDAIYIYKLTQYITQQYKFLSTQVIIAYVCIFLSSSPMQCFSNLFLPSADRREFSIKNGFIWTAIIFMLGSY